MRKIVGMLQLISRMLSERLVLSLLAFHFEYLDEPRAYEKKRRREHLLSQNWTWSGNRAPDFNFVMMTLLQELSGVGSLDYWLLSCGLEGSAL